MNILITGGAGYIGSHVAKQLLHSSTHCITILDNLSTGNQTTLQTLQNIRPFSFVQMDLADFDGVEKIIQEYKIEAILHFAASIVVPESVSNPLKYYMNNTVNTTNLIAKAKANGVKKFIFSSTAAVYGEPKSLPQSGIDETYETKPINPYGMSKLMSEKVIQDTASAHKEFKYVIFRYFNVAGADISYDGEKLSPKIGQSFPNATHLIKISAECACGKRDKMFIFGNDFATADGSGVRDYIHVDDLAAAHVMALDYLEDNESEIFNVGYGFGYSVKEVVQTMQQVTHKEFTVLDAPRRDGDPAALISNNTKIKAKMKWEPKYNDLGLICASAYEWEKRV